MNEDQFGSIIVSGVPGSGKSTIAHALAARARLAAHLEQDAIYNLIVAGNISKARLAESGRIAFRPDSPPEDFWQLDLARRHVCMLARSFAEHGVLPIVDDVVPNRSVLDEYRQRLPSPVRLIVLAPSLEVVMARDAARDKQVAGMWSHLVGPMTRELRGVGLWLDTTDLDVEATLALVDERWDETLL